MQRSSVETYRKIISENAGNLISLTIKKGRRYITVNNCVIENAYEHIFTVKIIGENLLKYSTISVCYADLITGNARIMMKNISKEA